MCGNVILQLLLQCFDAGIGVAFIDDKFQLQDKIEKLLVNADKMLTGINNVLDKNTQDNIKKSLAELSKTMEQFHQASAGVNTLIAENKTQIGGMVSNFNKQKNEK